MNIFKKQGVAVLLTIVMVAAAVGIGRAKAPVNPAPGPGASDIGHQPIAPDNAAPDTQTVYD